LQDCRSDERKLAKRDDNALPGALHNGYNVLCRSWIAGLSFRGVVDEMLESRGCIGVAGDASGV